MKPSSWNKISDKVNALSSRERIIIMATIFMVFQLLLALVIQPRMAARTQQAQAGFNQQIAQLQQQNLDIFRLTHELIEDSDASYIRRINELRVQIESYNSELLEISESFISPKEMVTFIKELLGKHHLRVEHLENRPAEAVTTNSSAEKDSNTRVAIYKHSVYFVASGNYTDQIRFLKKLEGLPWHIFWNKFHLETEDNNSPTLGIELFTLNFGPTWIKL